MTVLCWRHDTAAEGHEITVIVTLREVMLRSNTATQ